MNARELAARVLTRVLRDGAYAAASLDAELDKHAQLDARERGLATELVYGTLRCYTPLYEELARHTRKGLSKDDWAFLVPLLIGAYQVLLLDRVPAFAAVDAAVEQINARRGKGLAGFANALLRKLTRGTLSRDEANYQNVPAWLRAELERTIGAEQARALVGGSGADAGWLGLRLKAGTTLPAELTAAEPSQLVAGAYRLKQAGDPRKLASYQRGDFAIQEEGAQMVAVSLGAQLGERVWDACAGRGQKTTLLAERVGASNVWASDLHSSKLAALAREAERLGLPSIATRALDLTRGVGDLPNDFDRVLVDAPCTGTGTLRRRPEILLRLEPADPARLARLSERILRTAASRVRSGGRLVFAVCSVLEAECEAVVQRVSDVLAPTPFDAPEVLHAFGAGTSSFRLLPGVHGTDGYFAASLYRVS